MACVARGAAAFMLGDEAEAVRRLREGADSTLHHAIPAALCLAHLAVIHVEHRRWPEAAATAREARQQLAEIVTDPHSVLALAVTVLVATHAGRGDDVEVERSLCRQHLTGLVGVSPWLNLQTRVALARAAVLRGDRVDAAALIEEASAILEATPSAVGVARQLAGLRREVATRDTTQTFGPSSLTTAERRVLQLLPTHLSIAEIADRLYVSRNTVKSQTIAIYRKLGVSSRAAAVEIAATGGLLHDVRRD
jgi:LuxR family maltose regulon positive regulatory protein